MDAAATIKSDQPIPELQHLSITDPPANGSLDIPTDTLNPWNDSANDPVDEESGLKTPDPTALDPSISGGLASEPQELDHSLTHPNSEQILSEFDPLANQEEKDARDAWADAEGHPPPPAEEPQSPTPPPKDSSPATPAETPLSGTATSPFPSLSAFARSITSLTRPRPASQEVARSVPSPTTLSSLVAQQASQPAPTSTSTPPPPQQTEILDRDEPQFDFQKFLDQMKTRSAEPVAKYLKSFLNNFSKRTFTVNDQIKIINDFLSFISKQMRECDIWRNALDAEFDNAMEGMEKLVMNQLYQYTFTPQVAKAIPPRQITADDLERDRVLSQRISLFGWIEEKHLDVPVGEGSRGFIMFAQQELVKINHYKAPRDKLICILNCCKVIFGLIRHLHREEGADSFVPILIFVVLKANPEHLLSNVEFINRFRNPEKLQSEAGYYLSSLMGAVSFIETMDHSSLSNITQEEFEKNVEAAIQALPLSESSSPAIPHSEPVTPFQQQEQSKSLSHVGEESAQPLSLPTPAQTFSEDAKRLLQKTGDTISKPLNAISRIFNEALDGAESKLTYLPGPFAPFELARDGRTAQQPPIPHWSHPDQIRQYGSDPSPAPSSPGLVLQTPIAQQGNITPPIQTPYKPRVRRVPSPLPNSAGFDSPGFPVETPSRSGPYTHQPLTMGSSQHWQPITPPRVSALLGPDSAHGSRATTPGLDIAGMQAAIDNAHENAVVAARETLFQIFPSVEPEIVGWVLEGNEGDLGRSIETLLEMSGTSE